MQVAAATEVITGTSHASAQHLATAPPTRLEACGLTIEYVSARNISADDFVRRFVAENTPVILEDALDEAWFETFAWTPETFVQLAAPGTRVRVAPLMDNGRDKWVESAELWPGADKLDALPGVVHTDRVLAVAAARVEVPIEEFAASLRGVGNLPKLYADGASNLEQSFHFLAGQIPGPPEVGNSLLFKRTDLWLGSQTLSALHFDNYENLFAQLVGEKEFILCPPGDTAKLVDGRLRKAYASWCAEEGGRGQFNRHIGGLSTEAVLNYAAYDIDAPPAHYAASCEAQADARPRAPRRGAVSPLWVVAPSPGHTSSTWPLCIRSFFL